MFVYVSFEEVARVFIQNVSFCFDLRFSQKLIQTEEEEAKRDVKIDFMKSETKTFEFFVHLLISICIVLGPPVIMAWRSHGTNNEELVSKLRANEVVKSDKVERVMKSVDRGDFCKPQSAYFDSPQGIGKKI